MKRNIMLLGLLVITILMFSSCAEFIDVGKCLPIDGKVYGFWNGLWHGIITSFSFIGSLFNDEISVYAFNNNGAWYDFGYIIGIGGTLKGASSGVKRTRRRNTNKYHM